MTSTCAPAASRRFGLLALLVLLGCGGVAGAQETGALHLTLADAQQRAVAASHRLAEVGARRAGTLAGADARVAARQPNLSVQGGYSRTNHVDAFGLPASPGSSARVLYPDVPDNYRARLDLQWPIYTGGRLDALERAARAEALALTSDLDAARADLRLDVARAYWALVTARATVGVIESAVARARAYAADARARLAAGLIPPNEVASADAQAARQRVMLIEAAGQRDISMAELCRLIGEPLDRTVDPSDPLGAVSDAPVTQARAAGPASDLDVAGGGLRLDVARASAAPTRPERGALLHRIDAGEARGMAAALARRPLIAMGAGLDLARPNPRIFPRAERWDDSWDAGLSVTWSLWDGGRVRADVAEAASATEAVRQRLADFDAGTAFEVRQRQIELASSRAAVDAAAAGVRSAAEARRVVDERYAAGVIAHTEVLDAQVALLQAELDRTRALAAVKLAEARLTRATGQ